MSIAMSQPLCGFLHRRNRDHTNDAICIKCLRLVAIAWEPIHLIQSEARHVCGVITACDISGLSTGFGVRPSRALRLTVDLVRV